LFCHKSKCKLRTLLITLCPPLFSRGQHYRPGQNENYLIRPIVELKM
jgi:hypothetical protein